MFPQLNTINKRTCVLNLCINVEHEEVQNPKLKQIT